MSTGLALLPMYDWPEVRLATDRLWCALRDAFRAAGIDAPDELARQMDPARGWLHPRLTLAQTCGLPFVRTLHHRVALIGAPDYGVPGAPPGAYRSAVVVRADDPREDLRAFRGARLALNGRDSQSGYAALLHHAAPHARDGRFFGTMRVVGSHAAAAASVAATEADIAALDFVSWRLFARFRPDAARLRVLMLSDPTPGLPYIAAAGTNVERHRGAIAAAMRALDTATCETLGLRGFQPFDLVDYAVIADRAAAAEARFTH